MTVAFNHLGKLGQLGNQMFQYAAAKGVASKLDVPFMIPNHRQVFDDGIGNRYTILLFNVFKLTSASLLGTLRTENYVQENGFSFIGPTASIINSMGDKSEARSTMKNSGVPVIPGSDGVLKDVPEAEKFAEKVGYPVMVKASAGGGGKGMRLVNSKKELESAFASAQTEAKNSFNNDDLYLEKFVENPRHIEVQILSDNFGNTIHLGERECTIQRRHQKLIEESPSVVVNDKLRNKLGSAAISAAKAVNYVGVGTVEFLLDKNLDFYFGNLDLFFENF